MDTLEIAALDEALATVGEDIVLRRVNGEDPNTTNVDVTCRAVVRTFEPEELVGGIAQTVSRVIISPTEINAVGWPESGPNIPRRLDQVIIAGRIKDIEAVDPIYVGGRLVRIELRVLG
jgi:hypothetical protein